MKKIVVVGTRGIPNIMGGVETHCEELFPLVAKKGYDVTVVRRSDYVKDNLTEWNGVRLVDVLIIRDAQIKTYNETSSHTS